MNHGLISLTKESLPLKTTEGPREGEEMGVLLAICEGPGGGYSRGVGKGDRAAPEMSTPWTCWYWTLYQLVNAVMPPAPQGHFLHSVATSQPGISWPVGLASSLSLVWFAWICYVDSSECWLVLID